MRLTRAQHLRLGADFQAIRTQSSGGVCSAFRLRVRITESGIRRLGVIASKRVGNSVARSRAKRLLREAFRNSQDILPASCDILLIASWPIVEMGIRQVQDMFNEQAPRAARRAERSAKP